MLEGRRALDFAFELTRTPTLARAMRAQPLPPDTLVLIRIAAGNAETADEAAELTGLSLEAIKEAAVLYLQKVLFASDSDCYRILGVHPSSTRSQMREHMRWLMKWLHPDRNPDDWESVFAERVLKAWREASTLPPAEPKPDRNLAEVGKTARRRRSRRLIKQRWVPFPLRQQPQPRSARRRRAIAAAILVGALGLAFSSVSAIPPVSKWFVQATAAGSAQD